MVQVEMETPILQGTNVRLEPLGHHHVAGLVAAASDDPALYQWSPVPRNKAEADTYVETALAWRDAGSAVPFAIIRLGSPDSTASNDPTIIGSTRFFNIERWPWPAGHARHGHEFPDTCEIGYTWLASSAIRTAANTEAKLLMLAYAFETWQVLRVCLHADARNQRSRTAIERIGGKFEGILRAHRIAADHIARDSARYSIVAAEWPAVREQLLKRLHRE
jgi:RimJ/RimL family protein N-acetyltransferase